jgi:hypothetical protein
VAEQVVLKAYGGVEAGDVESGARGVGHTAMLPRAADGSVAPAWGIAVLVTG